MTGRRSVSMPLAMMACAAAIATSLVAVRGQIRWPGQRFAWTATTSAAW